MVEVAIIIEAEFVRLLSVVVRLSSLSWSVVRGLSSFPTFAL